MCHHAPLLSLSIFSLIFFFNYLCFSLAWEDQRESPCTYPEIRGIMMVMPRGRMAMHILVSSTWYSACSHTMHYCMQS